MSQFYNSLAVTILPPYIPSEAERKDPNLYADNVRRLYARNLQLPLSSEVRCLAEVRARVLTVCKTCLWTCRGCNLSLA